MRLFTAVAIAPEVRAAAARAAADLRRSLERSSPEFRARWTPEANFHITLVFLGETAEERLPAVRAALEPPLAISPFTLGLSGAGAFPPSGLPRVIWLGVSQGAPELAALHQEVSTRLRPLGFEPEHRPYHAHLTLARADPRARGDRAAIRRVLETASTGAGSCAASDVTLFRSRLSPNGPVYEALLRVPLKT